jgi:hypothetical protein
MSIAVKPHPAAGLPMVAARFTVKAPVTTRTAENAPAGTAVIRVRVSFNRRASPVAIGRNIAAPGPVVAMMLSKNQPPSIAAVSHRRATVRAWVRGRRRHAVRVIYVIPIMRPTLSAPVVPMDVVTVPAGRRAIHRQTPAVSRMAP